MRVRISFSRVNLKNPLKLSFFLLGNKFFRAGTKFCELWYHKGIQDGYSGKIDSKHTRYSSLCDWSDFWYY